MLLSFSCENFKSFKDKNEILMIPGRVSYRFENNIKNYKNQRVSRLGAIFGENAGGKSNFVTAIEALQDFVQNGKLNATFKEKMFFNYKKSISFTIELISNNRIYKYNLSILNGVQKEKLQVRSLKSKDYKDIYSLISSVDNKGDFVKASINNTYIKSISEEELTSRLDKGVLLQVFYILGLDFAKDVYDWLVNTLIVESPVGLSLSIRDMQRYKHRMEDDFMETSDKDVLSILKSKKYFEIFSLIDPSIQSIKVDDLQPFTETLIVRKKNNKEFIISLKEDSSGVWEFFSWSILIWRILDENKVVFADEFDRVLNPLLAERVISYIKNNNTGYGQLIFTTHNILLMNTDLFMKEQLYFVEKDKGTLVSSLYSLADFKDYRYEMVNVYELYIKGLLGGIPNG